MPQILREPNTVQSNSDMPSREDDILLSSMVVCTDENLSCDLQGEAVVLNLQSGTYFGLNPMGIRIWELIQKPAKVSSVRDQLLKEYEVDARHCEADLLTFLKQLHANNLIRVQSTEDN